MNYMTIKTIPIMIRRENTNICTILSTHIYIILCHWYTTENRFYHLDRSCFMMQYMSVTLWISYEAGLWVKCLYANKPVLQRTMLGILLAANHRIVYNFQKRQWNKMYVFLYFYFLLNLALDKFVFSLSKNLRK